MAKQRYEAMTDENTEIMRHYGEAAEKLLGTNLIGGTAFAFLRGMVAEAEMKPVLPTLAALLSEAAFYLPAVRRAIAEQWAGTDASEQTQLSAFSIYIAKALGADPAQTNKVIADHLAALAAGAARL